MNTLWIILQSDTPPLPPAVSWMIISALAFSFVWFLNRSVSKMDKSIDRLETTMNSIAERLIKHDTIIEGHAKRFEEHEKKIADLQIRKSRRQ